MQRSDPKAARLKPGYVLQAEDVVEFPMSDEDRRDMARGVDLFNRGEFWESHEAWEQIWLRHSEPSRVFLQALIQLTAFRFYLVNINEHTDPEKP